MKSGEKIILLDGSGFEYVCEIAVHGKDVNFTVVEKRKNESEPSIDVTLYQALLKSQEKFELILQKAVELGVCSIVPLRAERCQLPDLRKKDRCEKIMREASEQSERAKVPPLADIVTFDEMIENLDTSDTTTNLFLYEGMRDKKFKLPDLGVNVNVIIGPEGGFSPDEAQKMKAFCEKHKNSHILSLGKRILRSETASIAALSNILIHF